MKTSREYTVIHYIYLQTKRKYPKPFWLLLAQQEICQCYPILSQILSGCFLKVRTPCVHKWFKLGRFSLQGASTQTQKEVSTPFLKDAMKWSKRVWTLLEAFERLSEQDPVRFSLSFWKNLVQRRRSPPFLRTLHHFVGAPDHCYWRARQRCGRHGKKGRLGGTVGCAKPSLWSDQAKWKRNAVLDRSLCVHHFWEGY